MYKELSKERKKRMYDSGSICVNLPTSMLNMLGGMTTVTLEYFCKRNHSQDFMVLRADLTTCEGMLIFQDLDLHRESKDYPPEVLDELCRMSMSAMEKFAWSNGYQYLMITTTVPFFPEVFVERKFDIGPYNFQGKGWQGLKEIS